MLLHSNVYLLVSGLPEQEIQHVMQVVINVRRGHVTLILVQLGQCRLGQGWHGASGFFTQGKTSLGQVI